MKATFQGLDQQFGINKDGIEYICITDIALYKHPDRASVIVGGWLHDHNTSELGVTQSERLVKLNALAIRKKRVLLERERSSLPLFPGEGG